MYTETLLWHERLYHRDQLRAGRYAALADAEGFHAICFALEALGLRLHSRKADLGRYKPELAKLAADSVVLSSLSEAFPERFSGFESLYRHVRKARNDAMHTGVYARHATNAAIELCIGLEEALMKEQQTPRHRVQDYMVKTPITVEPWQPVAHARQLMLTHSFSYLPVHLGNWKLISEDALARFLWSGADFNACLSAPIEAVAGTALVTEEAMLLNPEAEIQELLHGDQKPWRLGLVLDKNGNLCGVLSPFELM